MLPLKKFFIAIPVIGIAFLYSCSSNIKYPQYSTQNVEQNRVIVKRTKPKTEYYNPKTRKGISYLKLGRCKKAINYFSHLKGFLPQYCLLVSYGYCGRLKKAKSEFSRLENRDINNRWQARIYAAFGFILMTEKQNVFRDYLTVAYAYDEKNRLARELMLKKHLSPLDKKRYFNRLFDWCGSYDK